MRLTPDQLAQFDRDGDLFFPGLFTPEEATTLTDTASALYARREAFNVREKGSDAVRTNFAAHLYSEPFAKLARHPRMIEPVQDLFGEPLHMHQFKINGKMAFEGDVWQWHQDYGSWKNDDLMPADRAMNVVRRLTRPTTMPEIPAYTAPSSEDHAAAAHALGFDEVLERRWPAGTLLDTHTHPFAVKARVMQGEMWLTVGDRTRHLRPGDTLALDAEIPHAERYGAEGATYWVARRHAIPDDKKL